MALKRRLIRERVLQALYAYELSRDSVDFVIDHILSDLKKHKEAFTSACELIRKVLEKTKELDDLIRERVEHWEFNRLAIIDKIVLRMCICELLFFEDIPPKVSINEAIEIARDYSTDKSDKFVNGVLDSIFADLKKAGKLQKSGRGLLEATVQKKAAR